MNSHRTCCWIAAYGSGDNPIETSTVLGVFGAVADVFDTSRMSGSYCGEKEKRVEDGKAWMAGSLARLQEDCNCPETVGSEFSLWKSDSEGLSFYINVACMSSMSESARWKRDPVVCIGIDCKLAKFPNSTRICAERASRVLIQDKSIWYGQIDCDQVSNIRHPSFRYAEVYSGWCWEKLVEQGTWLKYGLATRDRVRGVYWGNIFGPGFASRLLKSGFDEAIKNVYDNYGQQPVILREALGSMAVFVDNDPESFGKNRSHQLDGMSRSVLVGSILRFVMGNAGLL